jgi:hypothetical protein
MLALSRGENMPLFLCRWPNGDCSVVLARTKDDAIVELDQVGNAEDCPITQVRTFQVHFALTNQGDLALERFGEGTKEDVFAFAYPLLENALDEAYRGEGYADYESLPPDRRAAIVGAVEQERGRLGLEGVATPEPQTELGRDVKGRTDMPTILIDRLVRKHATKTLKNFKDRGKPS